MGDPVYQKAIHELVQLSEEARHRGHDADVASLATATADGRPSVRAISIVRIATSGLAFFADLRSGKGRQLQANPQAALSFHWPALQHQAIIEGAAVMLDEAESAELWRVVPRDYALGHWASESGASSTTADLRLDVSAYRKQFDEGRVPLPPTWRAFEIRPSRIALWQTGWRLLRQRREFIAEAEGWVEVQVNP